MPQYFRTNFIDVLLFLGVFVSLVDTTELFREDVAETLLTFKESLVDEFNVLHDWHDSQSPCNWTGVICDSSDTVVEGLNLNYRGLSGILSPVICQLPNLIWLKLKGNHFQGPFPVELSNCTELAMLDLSFNDFGGPLPEAISDFRSLTYLDVSANDFSGPIPGRIGQLSRLKYLNASDCSFTGAIPSQLGNLSELTTLFLSWNQFTPEYLPSSLSNLTRLQIFSCAGCPLSGTIPIWLESLKEMEFLELSYNNLIGSIPKELMRFPKLKMLELYINHLSGEIPGEIGNLTSITDLDLDSNHLTGPIPKEISSLKNLGLLHLWNNSLTGEIPEGFADLDLLYDIKLYQNQLTGHVPWHLGSRSKLIIFDVADNKLSGLVPPDLCEGGTLQQIVLLDNFFRGGIPAKYGSCTSLRKVLVQNNHLSGAVPKGLWGLPFMKMLDISNNFFNGTLPPNVGTAINLQNLDFSYNHISGSLPKELGNLKLLEKILASGNEISGTIPLELGFCSNLKQLYLDGNMLVDQIPSSLGFLDYLTELNLSGNALTGNIPDIFGKLDQLLKLDLSHNLLKGKIPADFAELHLLYFDLSFNNLSGPVPFPLGGAISQDSLKGNPDLCIPGQPRPKHCSKTENSVLKLWWLLEILLSVSLVTICALIIFKKQGYCKQLIMKDSPFKDAEWNIVRFYPLIFDKAEILDSLCTENLIGFGGSGEVYKVSLKSGDVVAVKMLNIKRTEEVYHGGEFTTEKETLGMIRHSNIIKLLCYMSNRETNLLVYEYMPNGSLGDFLRGSEAYLLDYPTRYKIALGTAQALSYLHHDCVPPILHRDIKPNNILLDDNFTAHIADFGIARMVHDLFPTGHTISHVPGSVGYIAPEYGYANRVSEKSDVYSFGVVVLQLLTGKQAVESEFGVGVDIVRWVASKLEAGEHLQQILDSRIVWASEEQALLLLRIGSLCTNRMPSNRPPMKHVVKLLLEVGDVWQLEKIRNLEDERSSTSPESDSAFSTGH